MRPALLSLLLVGCGGGPVEIVNHYRVIEPPADAAEPLEAKADRVVAPDAPPPVDAGSDVLELADVQPAADAPADTGPADVRPHVDAGSPCSECSASPDGGPALMCSFWCAPIYCPAACTTPPTPPPYGHDVDFGTYDGGTHYWCVCSR